MRHENSLAFSGKMQRNPLARKSRMSNGRKTLKKHQTVLTLRRLPLEVRSRSAFIIARRIQELGMELKAVASAINCTQQYARDLLQGTKIPSQGKVRDIING